MLTVKRLGKVLLEISSSALINASPNPLTRLGLQGCDLIGDNLQGVSFQGVDLSEVDLKRVDFTGAILTGTCLDPLNQPNRGNQPNRDVFQDSPHPFSKDSEGNLIGLRSRRSLYCGNQVYEVGKEYSAPWFSTSAVPCHPGLYVCPTWEHLVRVMSAAGKIFDLLENSVMVKFQEEDLHRVYDSYRVRKFTVVCNGT